MGLDGIQNYMIGTIVAVLVIAAGVFLIGSLVNSDNTLATDGQYAQFNKTFNKAGEVTASVNAVDQSIKSVGEENSGPLGWLNALVGTAYNGLKSVGTTLGFVSTTANEGAAFFGIPTFIVAILLLIATVIIVFGIYSAITKT